MLRNYHQQRNVWHVLLSQVQSSVEVEVPIDDDAVSAAKAKDGFRFRCKMQSLRKIAILAKVWDHGKVSMRQIDDSGKLSCYQIKAIPPV